MTASISINIPSYKYERYIRTAIESALAQTVAPIEILISDNHSPDRSYEIAKEYEGIAGVRLIRPPQHLMLGEHYQFVLEQAKGDYVCFLAADDALMSSFIARMQKALGNNTNVGMLAAACLECDESLVPRCVRGLGMPHNDLQPPDGYRHFKDGCTYSMTATIFSRELLGALKALPTNAGLATDWYWGLLLGLKSELRFLHEPLGYCRIHDANASYSGEARWREQALVMLRFVKETGNFESGLMGDLDKALRRLELSVVGSGEKSRSATLPFRIKKVLKTLLAYRYRGISPVLRMAEQGKSAALSKLQVRLRPLSVARAGAREKRKAASTI
ncbi:MAG TPA: glycosyltransferase family A protein [Candidatus Acidoferrum sp.]